MPSAARVYTVPPGPTHTPPLPHLLEVLLPALAPRAGGRGCIVGECVDARHPTLAGRVLVRWNDATGEHRHWVPTLQGLPVRALDRVLLVQPANFDELIITGILDGFARRPEGPRETVAAVELQRDEAVRVVGVDGQPLVELFQSDAGPVVRLLQADVNLEVPGTLRMKAARIELEASQGSVDIQASDDFHVRAEVINLN